MNKQTHLAMWDQQRQRHGITLRVLEQIPEAELGKHPIAGMRTPTELLVHMYVMLESMAKSVHTGTLESVDEAPIVAACSSKAKLRDYLARAWAAGDKQARSVTDVQLGATVSTPWGDSFPGNAIFGILTDEYLHHRGQLYAFVRTYGLQPVMVWDLEHNAPEFQPGAVTA